MPNVVARGVRFNYSTLGQGDDLVLLIHGLFVDNHASWYLSAAPVLAPHCKLVMHDLRGHDVRAASTVSDADLAGLTCPVLALYGEESHLRATGERLNEIIPDCTFRVVPGCAHFVLSHRPDIVREALLDWIVGAPTPS